MHDHHGRFRAAIRSRRSRCGRSVNVRARALLSVAMLFLLICRAAAQDTLPPAMEASGTDSGAPPTSQFGGGDVNFFSQDLGTILRLRYNTTSYGQDQRGNFDVGTMQIVTMDDSAVFFDGQVTMNETDGVGFNVGLGYRWLSFPSYSLNTGRMEGVSLWADGMHTEAGNFFPQIGVSLESLGELWDFRANGYIPLGAREQVGSFDPTGAIGFNANAIAPLTEATVDRSFFAGELEIARRLGSERDAWGFFGPYFVANDDDDSAGIRAGVRGYAYPDLLLQFAVSHDEIFDTNATFSVVWFVGRTRTDFHPACGTADRFREPVLRNDYVVLSHTKRAGAGTPLTQPGGAALRIVHVDSNAGPGGDGTFENPFDMLSDINGTGSQKGDIILAHSTSIFNNNPSAILKDNQRLLGEGNNLEFMVTTAEKGTIVIPESSPGARALARPIVNIPAGTDAVVLADNNEVANFTMDGQNLAGNRAIAAPAGGAGNPNLHDLLIRNTGDDAIFFKPEAFIDTNDVNNNGNTTELLVRGNVTIKDVTLTNIGDAATDSGIHVDSTTTADLTLSTTTLQEAISISNVTSTGGAGVGVNVENTHTSNVLANATNLTSYTYDGLATSAGGIRLNNFDGRFTGSNSTLTNGAATAKGAQVAGDSDGTMNFQSTVAFNSVNGTAFDINGDTLGVDQINGTVSVASIFTDPVATGISVQGVGTGGTASFSGTLTDTAAHTQTGDGVLVKSNDTGAAINFTGKLTIQTSADGFVAQDGGTLRASNPANSINATTTGQALVVKNMNIATTGVNFADVNRSSAAATSRAIELDTNTGGPITVGTATDTVGQAGTVSSGTTEAIFVRDSARVSVTGLQINNNAGATGVTVAKTNSNAMTVDLSDLQTDNGASGITVDGNSTTGNLNMTVNDTTINNPTTQGVRFANITAGTTVITNATVDAPGANAVVFTNVAKISLLQSHIKNGANGVFITHDSPTGAMDVTVDNLQLDTATATGIQVAHTSNDAFALKLTDSVLTEGNVLMDALGAGHFGLLVDNTDITTTTLNSAFALAFSSAAASGDVTIRNSSNFTAGNSRALLIEVDGAPTVRLLVRDSNFTNSSAFATAEFNGRDTSTMDGVTVQGNIFTNNGTGEDFTMTSFDTARIRLNLGGAATNMNTAAGSGNFILTETVGSDFDVRDTAGTFANTRNNGTVVPVPNAAAFDNLPADPPLPTVPP